MNDAARLALLQAASRITAWQQRSHGRLDPVAFIRANRAEFDRLMGEVLPKPQSKPWRDWPELIEREQKRIIKKLRRRDPGSGIHRTKMESDNLIRHHRIRPTAENFQAISDAVREARTPVVEPSVYRLHYLPPKTLSSQYHRAAPRAWQPQREGTPVERLQLGRSFRARSIGIALPHEFVANLHPDDAGFNPVVIDRHFIKLNKHFGYDNLIAAKLAWIDAPTGIEITYVAQWKGGILRGYIARVPLMPRVLGLSRGKWRTTEKLYMTPENALRAGLKMFGKDAAQHIHQEAAE